MLLKTLLNKALTTIAGLRKNSKHYTLANDSKYACDGVSAYRPGKVRISDAGIALREDGLESASQAPRPSLPRGEADARRAIAASDPGRLGGLGERSQVSAQNPPDWGPRRRLLSFDGSRKAGVQSAFEAWRPRGWGVDDRVARLLRAGGAEENG